MGNRSTFGAKVNNICARSQQRAKMNLSQKYRVEYNAFRDKFKQEYPFNPGDKKYAYRNSSTRAYMAWIQQMALRYLTYAHQEEYHDLYDAHKMQQLKDEGLYDEWVSRTSAGAGKTSSSRKRSKAATT